MKSKIVIKSIEYETELGRVEKNPLPYFGLESDYRFITLFIPISFGNTTQAVAIIATSSFEHGITRDVYKDAAALAMVERICRMFHVCHISELSGKIVVAVRESNDYIRGLGIPDMDYQGNEKISQYLIFHDFIEEAAMKYRTNISVAAYEK